MARILAKMIKLIALPGAELTVKYVGQKINLDWRKDFLLRCYEERLFRLKGLV